MPDLKSPIPCKILSVLICLFLLLEFQVFAQTTSEFEQTLAKAKAAYFDGDFEAVKTSLEKMVADFAEVEGMDTLKGETFLLLGAAYEKLEYMQLAVKYYCWAKEILGEGKSFEGLDLKSLKLYRENCETATGVAITVLIGQYELGRNAYFAGDYEEAKATLEALVATLESMEGWESLKGETFLVLGATYESLKYKDLSIKYYCKAKEILGEGRTIQGLQLKKLKWYKKKCPKTVVAAVAGRKKGGGFGKFFGTILGLAILGGVVWYLFFSKNAPLGKKGEYKSITARLSVTYKGLNSKGQRILTANGQEKLNENFQYPQAAGGDDDCDDATKTETYSYILNAENGRILINQKYVDWDYYNFVIPGTNRKVLCSNWDLTIEDYTWESGKDPGTPVPEGLEQLSLDLNSDCIEKSMRIHDCETSATITFSAPATRSKVKKTYSSSQSLIKTKK